MNPSVPTASFHSTARDNRDRSATARWHVPSTRRTSVLGGLVRLFQSGYALLGNALGQAKQRRLRVTETVSLGEKRFVSILTVDGVEYLVGGGASTISLLTTLPKADGSPEPLFSEAVHQAWQEKEQA